MLILLDLVRMIENNVNVSRPLSDLKSKTNIISQNKSMNIKAQPKKERICYEPSISISIKGSSSSDVFDTDDVTTKKTERDFNKLNRKTFHENGGKDENIENNVNELLLVNDNANANANATNESKKKRKNDESKKDKSKNRPSRSKAAIAEREKERALEREREELAKKELFDTEPLSKKEQQLIRRAYALGFTKGAGKRTKNKYLVNNNTVPKPKPNTPSKENRSQLLDTSCIQWDFYQPHCSDHFAAELFSHFSGYRGMNSDLSLRSCFGSLYINHLSDI